MSLIPRFIFRGSHDLLFFGSIIPITIKVLRGNREMAPLPTVVYALIGIITAMGFTLSAQSAHTLAFSKALVFDGISALRALPYCL